MANKERIKNIIDDLPDDTSLDEIVRELAAEFPSVHLIAMEEQLGKTAGLNLAFEGISTDLVVFTDANAVFDRKALMRLAEGFTDHEVGYVVGAARYIRANSTSAGKSEGLYWQFELELKRLESRFYSVVGGDGAIYAIRRQLYEPLAPEDINDFVNPVEIIAKGHRGIFDEHAVAYEDPANEYMKEFRRRRRIVCRTWGALVRYGISWARRCHPRFVFLLISHKIIRWFTMLWLLAAILSSAWLTVHDGAFVYQVCFAVLALLLVLGLMGGVLVTAMGRAPGLLATVYYFLLSNWAALLGIFDYFRGNRYVVWQHARSG